MFCEKTYHQNVKNSLFQNVTNLTEVTIPASVTKLDTATFYQSSNLERVYYLGTEEIEYKSNTMHEASNFTVNAWNFYTDVVTANTTLYAK